MSTADLLDALNEREVTLWIEGGRLRYRGPKGAMTDELKSRVADAKSDLIAMLREQLAADVTTSPLSHGQRALWFLHRNDPESTAYHVAFSARIRSAVDVPSLELALQALLDRHAALRTSFAAPGGRPVQRVHGYRPLSFEQADVQGVDDETLHDLVVERYNRPFDLEEGPAFRAHLLTRGASDHVLLIVVHHIVTDGWSQLMLLEELVALYEAQTSGKPAALPRGKTQYADYVRWQEDLLAGPEGEGLLGYWSDNLQGDLPDLELPTDRQRPPVQRFRGATFGFELSAELTQRVNELARETGATPYMVLLAAFQVLLHRYSGQDDILVGTASYGRNRSDFNDIVGYFINMLVQRATLSDDPSFLAHVDRVRESTLAAIDHQDLPFPLLVERLQPRRDPSRSPVFQACFVLHRFQHGARMQAFQISDDPELTENFGGLELSPFPIAQMEGQFDLTLEMIEWEDALEGCLKYNTDLFDADTIARMAGHLVVLLEAAAAAPDTPVSRLPLLTGSELHELREWNSNEVDYPSESTFHELFERQVDKTPDNPAITFGDRQLTYRELDEQANQLANYLRSLSIGPDDLVGVCIERSLEMMIAVVGVMKAGGAFLPLDPNYPVKRLAFMIEDSGVGVVLTQAGLRQLLPENGARTVCLDEASDREAIDSASRERPANSASPSNLAYVIYTSGSTGTPKGVLVEHRGLVNVCDSQWRAFGLGDHDKVLQFSSICFDAFVYEMVSALSVGATFCLGTRETLLPGPPLLEFLKEREISFIVVTPSTLSVLSPAELPKLHTITVAGEACPADLVARWVGGRRFFNLYGPTETTIWATYLQCTDDGRTPSIGRPIGNTAAYILDRNEQLVPVGVPGELCVSGAGVARGYLDRPELTRAKFIPDSFAESGGRIYKTGDLARYLPDGNIEFLGRVDDQVKVRGFRIELGEVEATLLEHPGIREVAVTAFGSTASERRLVAYVVPGADQAPDAAELREFLVDRLPEYFVPSAFVTMTELPVNPNGKIDRKALPVPESLAPGGGVRHVPPRTEEERTIAEVWRNVLTTDTIGVHDNFFDLGGHSLLLAEVQSQLEAVFAKKVSMVELLQYPNVESLAARLSRGDDDRSAAAAKIKARAGRQRDAMRRRRRPANKRSGQ